MEQLTALTGPTGTGTFTAYDQGAQLAAWRPRADAPEVIWESAHTKHEQGTAIRGGVPLCLPWFGPGVDGPFHPAHGFARIAPWRLRDRHETGHRTVLQWELTDADVTGVPGAEHFRHPFRATCVHDLGSDAEIQLTMANSGSETFRYELALHTYLHVGDVRQVRVTGLEGATYLDKLTGAEQQQEGELVLTGQTDRVYRSAGPVQVHDPVLGRTLTVTSTGAASTIVWNPWAEQAQSMADLGDEEWTQLLCVETGNVLADAVELAAGASHTTTARISVD
ncbi:D-hexose-6-phosphate mutarotase [Ornithinicoccus halotolerans]|uniref:D-hexose-6-phosphate mutarotase n=1 Tax=Ornithinicoccus halotolerans TaxID=1748220 RepID=UPI001296AA9B|nr:D-hexose-6-phosphate mutarotase [Ornithinicoccus halotolerans]